MKARLDPAGIRALARDPQLRRQAIAAAAEAARLARASAPRRTGHYAASIRAVPGTRPGDPPAFLTATDFKALWIERGAGPSPVRRGRPFPARHVLARAARAAGLTVKETPR